MAGIRFCAFTRSEIELLESLCNFTPEELEVFRRRAKGESVTGICMAMHMSEATVQRRIRAIKKKIVRSV